MTWKLKYVTKPEDTNGWHRIHGFLEGWGWHHAKDGKEHFLWESKVEASEFEKLSHEERIALSEKLEEEERIRLANLPKPKSLAGDFKLPLVNKTFPTLLADKIKGIKPKTEGRGNNG